MRHSLRIALYTLAAVFPCKAFDGLPESAKSPESWEHVFQSHLLSPSNPPPAHSFNSQQPGSVARLLSDHLYFNLPPADPSFHAGTDYAPNFPFHPGLHQDRGEPPSGFLPAPANFDEPPRLNTVAWEGPHQSCQTGPHNFAAYPNSVWSSHFPSHLSLHPVGTEPVRDPEPLPLVHSSEQEAFHNTDQHPTSRVLTASESTSNSHQLSRSSDGVPALKSRTRRRKSPEPPVQLRAPPPAGTRSHGLPIESFTKTYFKQPDAKLVITLHEYSDDHLLLFDEKEFRTFYSKPLKSKGSKVAGVEPQQQVDSVDAFLPNSKAWLTYWHRRSEVDPRQYLQRVTWCEAEPIFPLFLIYVELITAFLWEPNPKDYAEEFKQRCELFVKEANRMKPSTPSSLSSVQAQGPKNSSSTKKMKTPKCPTPLAKQPMRYVNVVWKLIFCWARDYRPTLLTINRARQCIIPKALKAFINGVFVASTEKLTQSTCEL
ncbi:putative signal peptide protein, partial [Puccinia sorghi]